MTTSELAQEIVDPAALAPHQLEVLTEDLYRVQAEVFDGVSKEAFRAYVVQSPARRTRIKVFRDEEGDAAGYVAMHAYAKSLRGEPCVVVRAEAGVRRAFRGVSIVGPFVVRHGECASAGRWRGRRPAGDRAAGTHG